MKNDPTKTEQQGPKAPKAPAAAEATSSTSRAPGGQGSSGSSGGSGSSGSGEGAGAGKASALLPAVGSPKGGGAIRGIGEKFSVNAATGTASLSVPIATSPGRSGFGPELSLSYDSGSGNGPFGLGFHLSVPAVTRKTDKGLPRYWDEGESDVFVMSGAEDLVPERRPSTGEHRYVQRGAYRAYRYRPRVEGAFVRIERWVHGNTRDVHWRVTTKENTTHIYGRSEASRIFDRASPSHVFSWLIEESRDDKGNVIRYGYEAENDDNVALTLSEKSRFDAAGQFVAKAQRYLKWIRYGNRVPNAPATPPVLDTTSSRPEDYLFEVLFDYGEHSVTAPSQTKPNSWPVRLDPFSSYRSGFEVRTYRLCQRVLMFHRFGPSDNAPPRLVQSTNFTYEPNPVGTYLRKVKHWGYIVGADDQILESKALPELTFEFEPATLHDDVAALPRESLAGLEGGVDGGRKQWVDLDGEGLPGILIDADGAWYYKANRGEGNFTPPKRLATMPSPGSLVGGVQKLEDLGGDGRLDLVQYGAPLQGYFTRTTEGTFEPLRTFQSIPNIDWNDPNLRFIDLDGDGHGDLLVTEEQAFVWYRSKGKAGFEPALKWLHSSDENIAPAVVFADGTQSIQLADMSGDGLVDIVRVRNGEVCYWPNLGYGRFGAKITLENCPTFANFDEFDARRLRFGDVDGSGTTDLLYLGRKEVSLYANESGNRLSPSQPIRSLPPVDNLANVSVVDLLGQGTSCLVWSSPLPSAANHPVFYVDLMGGKKPHVLKTVTNNLGARTTITYSTSTQHYLRDKAEGLNWLTRLSFPVQVVDRIEHEDLVTSSRLVTTYRYHHGFFDGEEREFRGFACVEQWDAETYEEGTSGKLNQKPVHTKTWFHTGAWLEGKRLEDGLKDEYFVGGVSGELKDFCLPDTVIESDELGAPMSVQDAREAARALRGHVLRTEIYADDDDVILRRIPYLVTEQNFAVRRIQSSSAAPKGAKHGVFFSYPRETLTIHTERKVSDPRVAHELVLAVNKYGDVERKASVVYGRVERAGVTLPDEQKRAYATLTEARFAVNDVTPEPGETELPEHKWYRASVPCEQATWELVGLPKRTLWTKSELEAEIALLPMAQYETPVAEGTRARRLVEHNRQLFKSETAGDPHEYLDLGKVGEHAIPFEKYALALTPGLVSTLIGESATLGGTTGQLTTTILEGEGKYAHPNFAPRDSTSSDDVNYWAPSGRVKLDTANFYLPVEATDPFGKTYSVEYDDYSLLLKATVDPLGNRIEAINEYRVLAPKEIKDPNLNRSAVGFDALGMVVWTAVMGKVGANEGDTPEHPTTRFEYNLDNWAVNARPSYVKTSVREVHYYPGLTDDVPWQESFTYSDGFGRVVMQKVQAEAGLVPGIASEVTNRWVGTGRTVFNNKGNPVKQYEPFFSATPEYEDEATVVERGVTPVIHYDPLDRVVRTDLPNGTFSKVVFDAWRQENWDPNDNVLDIECTWYTSRIGGALGDAERRAAQRAAAHANTPSVTHLDSLGRAFLVEADNGPDPTNPTAKLVYQTRTDLDIEGNQLGIIDALNNRTIDQKFDVLGRRVAVTSPDAGKRLSVVDVAGKPLRSWDSRGQTMRSTYDALQRPTHVCVRQKDSADEDVMVRTIYGESLDTAQTLNLRGQTYMVFDGAGLAKSEEFDFKGNLEFSARHLAKTYTETPKWNALPELNSDPAAGPIVTPANVEAEATKDPGGLLELNNDPNVPTRFSTRSEYDALNRVISSTAPDGSVSKPEYNRANFLERMLVTAGGSPRAAVHRMSYNEKGQRLECTYVGEQDPESTAVYRTRYTYDEKTFRLKTLVTERTDGGVALQRLTYTYDPVGNITEIADNSDLSPILVNAPVEGHGHYWYDAIYRLIRAEGREHPGQQTTALDSVELYSSLPHANDATALRRYFEEYEYDEVGNIKSFHHGLVVPDIRFPDWTRTYNYAPGSNQLSSTTEPNESGSTYIYTYAYDEHGSMTRLPKLPVIQWDYADRMRRCEKSNGTVGTVYFTYDAAGQRVRKIYEHAPYREERIYLGGYEIYRRVNSGTLDVHRTTLHVMDDQRRVAMVENTLADPDVTAGRRWRFQLDNHLGTATLELDHEGNVISYEEYHPYGTSAFRVQRSATGFSLKRYRYTGKERDEETSLYYHGARYYAPWLGRWTAADPAGIVDGPNVYSYVRNSPITGNDSTGTKTECDSSVMSCNEPERNASYSSESEQQMSSPLLREVDQMNADNALALDAIRSGSAVVTPYTGEDLERDALAALEGTETPTARLERQVAAAGRERQRQQEVEDAHEMEVQKELPSLGYSLIPVVGPSWSAGVHFSHGNIGRGLLFSGLTVADAFFVGSVGRGLLRGALSLSARETAPRLWTYSYRPTFSGEIFEASAGGRAWATSYAPGEWAFGGGMNNTLTRMWRTGRVAPFKSQMEIVGAAREQFVPVQAFGPLRGWKQMAGQHYALRPGNLNLATGAFSEATSLQLTRMAAERTLYLGGDALVMGSFRLGLGISAYNMD